MLLLKCCCITCEIWGAYIWSNQRYYLLSKGCLEFLLLCCKSSNFQNAVSESAFFSLNSCRYSWLFPKLLSSKAWIFVFQGDTFFFFFPLGIEFHGNYFDQWLNKDTKILRPTNVLSLPLEPSNLFMSILVLILK